MAGVVQRITGISPGTPLQCGADQTAALLQLGHFAPKAVIGAHVTRLLVDTGADPGLSGLRLSEEVRKAAAAGQARRRTRQRPPRAQLLYPRVRYLPTRCWALGPRHETRKQCTHSPPTPIWATEVGCPALPLYGRLQGCFEVFFLAFELLLRGRLQGWSGYCICSCEHHTGYRGQWRD
jgi:hypothetical protein